MNVLIVDDHAAFRARARRMLEGAGHTVVGEVGTVSAGLRESERLSPDVVLLDIQVGDGDGLAIVDELLERPRPPHVVLVSGREAEDYGTRLQDTRAAGFIHKPDLSAERFAAALAPGRGPARDARPARRGPAGARRPTGGAPDDTDLAVVVADDSMLIRAGIGKALSARGIVVVAEAEDGDELVRKVAAHRPDAAVVDIRMPPTGTDEGLRAAVVLADRAPSVGVLILSDHLEPAYATRLLEEGTRGRGYLLKETITDLDALAEAVRRVAAGESVVDPAIVRHVIEVLRADDPLAALTGREREILELMAAGRSNAAIATELVISPRTVESHVSSLFGKLGLPDRPDDHRRVLAVLAYLRA